MKFHEEGFGPERPSGATSPVSNPQTIMDESSSQNSLRNRRILVGPTEIAGFTSRIAMALASSGAIVLLFNSRHHSFNPKVPESENLRQLLHRSVGAASRWQDRRGFAGAAGSLLAKGIEFIAFLKTCFWAETVVMVGGKGFFGGGLEYAFMRMLGKQVVHVFVGTASRPRYQSGYAKGIVAEGRVNMKGLRRLAKRTRRQARRIRGISRHATIVIENPLCGHFYERPFVNFFKLGAPMDAAALEKHPRILDSTPPRAEGRIRVLHCPSRPEIKGSAHIQSVMDRLVQDGLPIEFRQLTGIPFAQVLHEISQCDFVIDELYSDSPLAGFAAEAASFAKPAVVGGYGWKLFGDFLRPDEMPPTRVCHPDDLEEVVRDLTLSSAKRESLGNEVREFLLNRWSERGFAERFARVVSGDIPSDWWVKPEEVRYMHGLGMSETEVRGLIGALVENFGADVLQVDHLPELQKALLAFCQGQPASYSTAPGLASKSS